jgi:hypothetical protein
MKIYWPLVASCAAAALASSVHAAVVNQRFNIDSKMMLNQTTLLSIGTSAPDFSPITANVGSASYGSTISNLESTATSLRIASSMTPLSIYRGSSAGSGQYEVAAGQTVAVTWAWGHTTDSGGWRVVDNATNSVVASLTFSQGQFTATGGAFASTASGNATVQVATAGSYRFEAFYFGRNNPTSSLVEFGFAVPGPGALALAAIAGCGARRRR